MVGLKFIFVMINMTKELKCSSGTGKSLNQLFPINHHLVITLWWGLNRMMNMLNKKIHIKRRLNGLRRITIHK